MSPDDLAGLDVRLVEGRATDLDLAGRRVVLHGGDAMAFDRLVVATGSSPRMRAGAGASAGVHTLRTAADGAAIRAARPRGPAWSSSGAGSSAPRSPGR